MLHEHGLDTEDRSPSNPQIQQARAQASSIKNVTDLREMEATLQAKVNGLVDQKFSIYPNVIKQNLADELDFSGVAQNAHRKRVGLLKLWKKVEGTSWG